jgi:S1-C subfamily serine protease
MRKILSLTLLFALMAFAPISQKSIKQLFNNEGVGICSAWALRDKPGVWVTANHCPAHGAKVGEIIKQDPENDLAAFRGDTVKGLDVATEDVQLLDEVIVAAFPGGQPFFFAVPGNIVSFTKEKVEGMELEFAIVADVGMPGMSGGPVLNKSGEVVGLVHAAQDVSGVNLTGISRLRILRAFLKGL